MSYQAATVIAMLGVITLLYWWGRDLKGTSVFSNGLRYLIKGVTIGLFLPVLSYAIRIQEESTGGAVFIESLQGIITTQYSVLVWVWIITIAFLVLAFLFDLLQGFGGRKNG